MTENQYLNDSALVMFKGDVKRAAHYRKKSYHALINSFYLQRTLGEQCLIYLRNLLRFEKQLPKEARHFLRVIPPPSYDKSLPRVGA